MTMTKLILLIIVIGTFFKKMQQKKRLQEERGQEGTAGSTTLEEPEEKPSFSLFNFAESERPDVPIPPAEPEIKQEFKKMPENREAEKWVEPEKTFVQPIAPVVLPPTSRRSAQSVLSASSLRQAFIYSEIIGRPVALREQSETSVTGI